MISDRDGTTISGPLPEQYGKGLTEKMRINMIHHDYSDDDIYSGRWHEVFIIGSAVFTKDGVEESAPYHYEGRVLFLNVRNTVVFMSTELYSSAIMNPDLSRLLAFFNRYRDEVFFMNGEPKVPSWIMDEWIKMYGDQ